MERHAQTTDSCNRFVTIFPKNVLSSKLYYYQVDPGKRNRLIPKLFSMTMTRLKDISGYRVVAHEHFLYFVGGREFETGAFRKYILRFDTRTNTWSKGAEMRTPRFRHTATVVNGLIYVIGGEGKGGKILSSVELYDPVYDLWAKLPHLPHPTADHATCAIGKTLYVSGGCVDISNSMSDCFWKFHVSDDDFWSDVIESDDCVSMGISNNLPEVREKHCMVNCLNRIYCLGGITVEGTGKFRKAKVEENVYVFNPDDPGWRLESAQTLNPRCCAGVVVLGHNIFMIGGQKLHGTSVAPVEYYNTVKKRWTELFNMSESGFSNTDCCLNNVPTSNKEFSKLGLVIQGNWIMW